MTRAGNRRYYRAADVALARRIQTLLARDGYTVRGVQRLLAEGGVEPVSAPSSPPRSDPLAELRAIRTLLADALAGA